MVQSTSSVQLPLSCKLVINGEEVSSSSGKQFPRENPADRRQIVTLAEEADAGDMRSAIDSARNALDSNSDNWGHQLQAQRECPIPNSAADAGECR